MRCTPRRRFSLVPGAGGRPAVDLQIEPEDPLPVNRPPVRGKASDPFHCGGFREAPRATHPMATQGQEGTRAHQANWPGSAWIVELITTTRTRKGPRAVACHRFISTLRTTPEALLRLIR